jgi:transcriptional regulator with XRE-family HTH domain
MAEVDIPDRISTLTRTVGISQQRLADQVGVSRRAIRRYESGEIRPRPEIRKRINRVYNRATLGVKRTPSGRPRYTKRGIVYDERVREGIDAAEEAGMQRRRAIIREAPKTQRARMMKREIENLDETRERDRREAYAQARRAYVSKQSARVSFAQADRVAQMTDVQLRSELSRLDIAGRGRRGINKEQRQILLDRYHRSRGEAALSRSEEQWKDFAERRTLTSEPGGVKGGDVLWMTD